MKNDKRCQNQDRGIPGLAILHAWLDMKCPSLYCSEHLTKGPIIPLKMDHSTGVFIPDNSTLSQKYIALITTLL